MGLDIVIKARNEHKTEVESCHGLSRTFCRLICDLVDLKTGVPELKQLLGAKALVLIEQVNVWEMDNRILYRKDPELTKEEVDEYYEKSWQLADLVLEEFKNLYSQIEKDPSQLQNLDLNYDWIPTYFGDLLKNKGRHVVDRNFGWDLRNIIEYLSGLEANSEMRFHFS